MESVRIGKCQNAFFFKIGKVSESESVRIRKCQNAFFFKIGKCQNRKVLELESVRIGKCQNQKVSELESVRNGKCQNREVSEHFPILTLSNFFQNGQNVDSDTFQF